MRVPSVSCTKTSISQTPSGRTTIRPYAVRTWTQSDARLSQKSKPRLGLACTPSEWWSMWGSAAHLNVLHGAHEVVHQALAIPAHHRDLDAQHRLSIVSDMTWQPAENMQVWNELGSGLRVRVRVRVRVRIDGTV